MLEEIGLVFGGVFFIFGVMLLYGASNADAARDSERRGVYVARRDNHISDREVEDEMEAPLQSLPRALAFAVRRSTLALERCRVKNR
jgi:hypothetical protein